MKNIEVKELDYHCILDKVEGDLDMYKMCYQQ